MSRVMASNARSNRNMKCRPLDRHRALLVGALFVAQLASAGTGSAAPPSANDAELGRCIATVSGGRPWLERTLWGLRDQEGGWVGAEVRNSNGSHDLGPLQVNSWWVPRLAAILRRPESHVRWWLIHDACFNVSAARWIFLSGLEVAGDYWKAVGIYHSPTDWRQRRYASEVAAKLQRRYGAVIFRSSRE